MLLHANSDFEERETFFVEVILPLSLSINYTYRVPCELNEEVAVGKRVVVQFGKHKIYTALIKSVHHQAPAHYQAKYILDVVDKQPILYPRQLQFWDWLKAYYLCNEGDIMAAALPSGLKLASETTVSLKGHPEESIIDLTEKERLVYEFLVQKGKFQVDKMANLFGQKSIYQLLNTLIEKDLVVVEEEMTDKFKPMTKTFVRLNPVFTEEEALKELFSTLERSPKQLEALMWLLKLQKESSSILKSKLIEESGCGQSAYKSLVDKQIFVQTNQVVSRLLEGESAIDLNYALSEAQERALAQVKACWKDTDVTLLFGVTASGKTQIYLKLIQEFLEQGKQALFLLPEIALTTQIVERIKLFFGNKIGVYHSKFNENERVEIWNKVLSGQYQVVIGARSAVFLPFQNLGLVIVDEEHESSYKQQDPAPRYHARDAAIYLAMRSSAKVLLGSASPSIESYYNAQTGKYGLVRLDERFGQVLLPEFKIVNITEAKLKKEMMSFFTQDLIQEIKSVIDQGNQVIIFQNRRGYATILICSTCGFAPKCVNCDVSLTFHKSSGKLHCHYCGFQENSLTSCPACGSVHIEQKGLGTERLEEELNLIFPEVKTTRLDLDTAKSKKGMHAIISDFQENKSQILIGTQMVAKGLDFDHVQLIGIINADIILNYPDFRSFERAYQLLAQVAGRAGRRDVQGKAVVQTYNENHRILQYVKRNDYQAMFEMELSEREKFNYPPFSRLMMITLKHRNFNTLNLAAHYLAKELKHFLGPRVLGPQPPLVGRIRNYYLLQIQLKIEKQVSVGGVKTSIVDLVKHFHTIKEFKSVIVQIDVDPY